MSSEDAQLVDGIVMHRKWMSLDLKKEILQVIVPRERAMTVLRKACDFPTGGHFGVNKTFRKVHERFYWSTYKNDIDK